MGLKLIFNPIEAILEFVNADSGPTLFLGYFADYAALIAAYPTGVDGNYAILGSTDTIWIWDTTTMAWIDSGTSPVTPTNTTKISVTDTIATGATYDVTTGFVGVDYTTSGDTGDLDVDATAFNNAEKISIYLNGTYMVKGVDVVWDTATTFVLNHIADNTDEIIVIS